MTNSITGGENAVLFYITYDGVDDDFIIIIIFVVVVVVVVVVVALQPFVGPWPLFQFLDPIHSRYNSLDEGSARRKAATYTQNNANTE
jgi:hypothetical protein